MEFNEQLLLKVDFGACLYSRNTVSQMLHFPAACAAGSAFWVTFLSQHFCVHTRVKSYIMCMFVYKSKIGGSVSFVSAIASNSGCHAVSSTLSSSCVCAAVIWGFDRLPGECVRWK